MSTHPVVLHPGVEDDLALIYQHYEQFDPVLPDRFQARMDQQVERLEQYPESGAVLFETYRRVVLERFPYMAVYAVRDDRVEILAVVGVRRDPAWIRTTVAGRFDD